jgi:hypothetical protein
LYNAFAKKIQKMRLYARFHTYAAVQLRPSLFWDVMQYRLAASYTDILGQPIGPTSKNEAAPRRIPEQKRPLCLSA